MGWGITPYPGQIAPEGHLAHFCPSVPERVKLNFSVKVSCLSGVIFHISVYIFRYSEHVMNLCRTVRPTVRVFPIPPLEADAFQQFTRRVHGESLLACDEHLNGLIPHPRLRGKATEERTLTCEQTLFRREPNVTVGVFERLAVDTVHDDRRFEMCGSPKSAVRVSTGTAKTSH